ncbi:capsule polysaccharide synthase Cps1 [Apiospora rasikravindrae]|uniref:Capsule polysaccharide synthase Cps1 n=1 Tax=Apiospora rasikravindrae TaxID=990691 RepID=A0ABR1U2T0_9PEZI
MALPLWLSKALSAPGWASFLAFITVTLPYLFGAEFVPAWWPLTAEMAFVALFFFRHWRSVVHFFGRLIYRPYPLPAKPTYLPSKDVTIVIPTLDPAHLTFRRCLKSVCANAPARIFIVTVGKDKYEAAEEALHTVRSEYPHTKIQVSYTLIANKRAQINSVIDSIETPITLLVADDDNYIHRWCVDHGIKIKFQADAGAVIQNHNNSNDEASSSSAVVGIADLGEYPRFLQQCLRWARTTFRSNPRMLLSPRAWRQHPWSMYGVQAATLTNFALSVDYLLLCLFRRTAWHVSRSWMVYVLVAFIVLSKLPKLHT